MDGPAFLARVREYAHDGWRLSIINTTTLLPTEDVPGGSFDVTWSFAKDARFEHVREHVLPGDDVPSIGEWFDGAFLYENEMRELFGVNVTGIAVDLKGQLYQTATKVPFAPSAIRARLEATGRLEAGGKHEAGATPAPRPVPAAASGTAASAPAPVRGAHPAPGTPEKQS